MPDENDVTTSTQEVDVIGGWLVTHFTRTWDRRTPLAAFDAQIASAEKEVADAQERLDVLTATKADVEVQVAEALKVAPAPTPLQDIKTQ